MVITCNSDVLTRVQKQITEQVEYASIKSMQTFRDEICEVLELVHKTPFNLIHDLNTRLEALKEESFNKHIENQVADCRSQLIEVIKLNNKGTEMQIKFLNEGCQGRCDGIKESFDERQLRLERSI